MAQPCACNLQKRHATKYPDWVIACTKALWLHQTGLAGQRGNASPPSFVEPPLGNQDGHFPVRPCAHPARQRQERRQPARSHPCVAGQPAPGGAARAQRPGHGSHRRCGDGLRHAGGRARRQHCPHGGAAGWLRPVRASAADQPLLRLGPGGRGFCRCQGDGRPGRPGGGWRHRDDVAPADGRRRRRLGAGPAGGVQDALCDAGHLRRPAGLAARPQPQRRRCLCGRKPPPRRAGLERGPF